MIKTRKIANQTLANMLELPPVGLPVQRESSKTVLGIERNEALTCFWRIHLMLFLSLVKAFQAKRLPQNAGFAAFWT